MQQQVPVILGIDAGTTSVKTAAFDQNGRLLDLVRMPVEVEYGERGEAEMAMDKVWIAVLSTLMTVVDHLNAQRHFEVKAIGITGQGDGAWLVDKDGYPVRPARIWLDSRMNDQIEAWREDGRAAAVQQATGSALFAGALPMLASGVLREDVATQVYQLNCKDWIRYRLTDERATDPSEASRTYLNTATGDYDTALLESLGQSSVTSWLPGIRNPVEIGGVVRDVLAETIGLPKNVPVSIGMVDTAAAGVGVGAIRDGDGYGILGTTGFVGVNQPSRAHARNANSILLRTGRGEQILECLAPMTGTPNLDWVRKTLLLDERPWVDVERDAAGVAPGSGGVIYLPYGAPGGERAPFNDSAASASWMGMSVRTTAGQLLRSVYEGLAYSITECLNSLELSGNFSICGGGSESDLFCQILADVSGRQILRPLTPEVGARGSAIIAATAIGMFDSLQAAAQAFIQKTERFVPNTELAPIYVAGYDTFVATRDAIRPEWPKLKSLRSMQPFETTQVV